MPQPFRGPRVAGTARASSTATAPTATRSSGRSGSTGPEVTHTIKATIDLALEAKGAGEEKVISFNFCGHGHFDLAAYEACLAGNLVDLEYSEDTDRAVARIPG